MDRTKAENIIDLIYSCSFKEVQDLLEDEWYKLLDDEDESDNDFVAISALYDILDGMVGDSPHFDLMYDILSTIEDYDGTEDLEPWVRALYGGVAETKVSKAGMKAEEKAFIDLYLSEDSQDTSSLFGEHDWRTILAKYPIEMTEDEEVVKNALKEAEEYLDDKHKSFFYLASARFYETEGDHETAFVHYLKAYELCKEIYGPLSINTLFPLFEIDFYMISDEQIEKLKTIYEDIVANTGVDKDIMSVIYALSDIYDMKEEYEKESDLLLDAIVRKFNPDADFSSGLEIVARLMATQNETGTSHEDITRAVFKKSKEILQESEDAGYATLMFMTFFFVKDEKKTFALIEEFENETEKGSPLNLDLRFFKASYYLQHLKKPKEALKIFEGLIEETEAAFEKESQRYITLKFTISNIYLALENEKKSTKILHELADIIMKSDFTPSETAVILMPCAFDLRDKGKIKKALKYMERVKEAIDSGELYIDMDDEAFIYAEMSETYFEEDDYENAISYAIEAYELLKELKGAKDHDTVEAGWRIANIYFSYGELDKSQEWTKEVLKHTKAKDFDVDLKANLLITLAMSEILTNKFKKAEKTIDKALSLLESNPDSDQDLIDRAAFVLAALHISKGEFEEAEEIISHYKIEYLLQEEPNFTFV